MQYRACKLSCAVLYRSAASVARSRRFKTYPIRVSDDSIIQRRYTRTCIFVYSYGHVHDTCVYGSLTVDIFV